MKWYEGVLEFRAPRISQSDINICSALTRTKILHELMVPFLVTANYRAAGGLLTDGAMVTPNDKNGNKGAKAASRKGCFGRI